MQEYQTRRSCRVALSIPIRVIGIDYRGIDFTEEAITLIVNLHGAKIRLLHQLMPDAEIHVLSRPTGVESIFRVVAKLQSPELSFTYWGVENLEPGKDIWGVDIPELRPGSQIKVGVIMECPLCSARESMFADEHLQVSLQEKGGMERTCPVCMNLGLWKLLPFRGASKTPN